MQFSRPFNSLASRLVLFGILLVIFGGTLRYVLHARFLQDDLTTVIAAEQLALARVVAQDVDEKIKLRRKFLARLADTLPTPLLDRPEALREWLAERYELLPVFSLGLVVADANGVVVADYPPAPGRKGARLADNPDFARLARSTEQVVNLGKPLHGPYTKQPALPMGTPVLARDGSVLAFLIGITALNSPDFLDRVINGRIGETGGFLLISPGDALFVAASDPAFVLKPTPPAGVNRLHDSAMAGFRGTGVTINAAGVEELSTIVGLTATDWFLVARMPTAEAFAPIREARNNILLHSAVAVLLVVFVAGFFIRRVLRPLHDAADLAERMTQDQIPLVPLPVARDDEVGHLTAAFNRLLDKLAQSRQELQHLAHHDPLTGLPNRNLLADRMQHGLARAARLQTRVALLFMDLDGFKAINDELGHDAGDRALLEVARRLSGILRQADTLSRVGGDEFVLFLSDIPEASDEGIVAVAGKCIEALSQPVILDGEARFLGVSIGIAVSTGDDDPEALLLAADKAMYVAKDRGKGCYVFAGAAD